MLKRHLKMVMGMLCCLLAVLALTGALQPGHAEILDYDEYMADKPAGMDGLFVLDAHTALLTGDAVLGNGQISIDEIGSVAYRFATEADCAYQLEITCRSIEGKRNDVEYAVLVDDGIPFSEASKLKLRRVWKSAGPITQTNQGDDIVPEQVLAEDSSIHLVQDSDGLYAEPFLFRFAPGEHTLALDFARAGIIIEQVRLVPMQQVATYADYMLPWSAEEYEQLHTQILAIREIPETPANYFVYRSLTNAFRKVAYNANINPREAIVDYNLQINKEVQRKLKEFE